MLGRAGTAEAGTFFARDAACQDIAAATAGGHLVFYESPAARIERTVFLPEIKPGACDRPKTAPHGIPWRENIRKESQCLRISLFRHNARILIP